MPCKILGSQNSVDHDSNSTTDLLMEPAASFFSTYAVHEDMNLFPILLQKNFLQN
jgi:hypothetical protein